MEKKIYIQPSANVFQVNPSEVICGSGGDSASLSNGNGGTGGGVITGPGGISGNSASSRSDWDCYEGRW